MCARNGCDLIVAANEPRINQAARDIEGLGATCRAVEADLATLEGVDRLYDAVKQDGRPVGALLVNAGHVVSGRHNKLQTAIASVTPAGILAHMHKNMAEPGTAKS